jgi:DNA-directed RNA polymerase
MLSEGSITLQDESFEMVVNQYTPMIHQIINKCRIYKDRDMYFQEGLIALWNAFKNFNEEKGTFSTYAYTMIYGHVRNVLSKENRFSTRNITSSEDVLNLSSIMDRNFNTTEILVVSEKVLEKYEYELIYRRYFLNEPLTDVSSFLGVSLAKAKKDILCAKKKLKKYL